MSIKHMYYRLYQGVFRVAVNFLDWTPPKIISGPGSVKKLPQVIKEKGLNKMMIVTDKGLTGLNLLDGLYEGLKADGIDYIVYDKTQPNPSIDNIEEVRKLYLDNGCQGFIAFGGGSPMDCAKGAAARVVCPNKTVQKMRGQLKVRKKLPPFFAVPTTAGTGSETTLAAVVTDTKTHEKYALNDPVLRPKYAVLDPELTVGLPPHITSTTGMDALTHAIEGYTTKAAWEMTDMFHLKAIEIISRSLRDAVDNKKEGREGMALGQYIAGMGFSNVGLGIVHSMAHPLGAVYDTPHGVANAIILPTVMEYNAEATGDKYKYIAKAMGVEGTENMTVEEYRKAAIDAVKQLSHDVGIPANLKDIVKREDIPFLAQSAYDDACRPGNPRDTSVEDITKLYESLI